MRDMPTMADIRAAARVAGNHFFEPATMRFFDSRVERGGPYAAGGGCAFFITSEQFHDGRGYSAPRRYTVRYFRPDPVNIGTAEGTDFQEFPTLDAARERARELANPSAAWIRAYRSIRNSEIGA